MRLRKTYQGRLPDNKILNNVSNSATDTYSCKQINEMLIFEEEDPTVPEHVKNISEQDIKRWDEGAGGVVEESDPTVPAHVKAITQEDIDNWNSGTGGGGGTGGSGASVDQIYPVGSIYISASNTVDPNVIFTGTQWERFGKGRTLVGVNEDDEDFATVGLVGGHKNLQNHTHTISSSGAHKHATQGRTSAGSTTPSIFESLAGTGGTRTVNVPRSGTNGEHTHTVNATGDGDSENLQPFITVFMWVRTA